MSDQPVNESNEPARVEESSEFQTPEFQEPTPEPMEAPVEIPAPELPPVQDEAPATPEEEALVPDPEASTAFEPGGAYEPPTDFAGHTAFNEQDVQHIQ